MVNIDLAPVMHVPRTSQCNNAFLHQISQILDCRAWTPEAPMPLPTGGKNIPRLGSVTLTGGPAAAAAAAVVEFCVQAFGVPFACGWRSRNCGGGCCTL